MKILKYIFVGILLLSIKTYSQYLLIPMDLSQTDHLKAYGIAYLALKKNVNVEWLLNYRGGSFLLQNFPGLEQECLIRGVRTEKIDATVVNQIYATIEQENMERVLLEKAPKIAVYTPPNKQPWDDAVTLALTYAEIDYDKIYDEEVLAGKLADYDWLHLHHEDFTGQYGKFYGSFRNAPWYILEVQTNEALAAKLGYKSVSEEKKAVAWEIRQYVMDGGFLFAMCSATDALDIALSAEGVDIVDIPFDGTPPDPNYLQKLDYTKTLAFQDFKLYTDPNIYEFSDIDATNHRKVSRENDYFTLFDFSAKWDPIPTMLTQNHTMLIKGFMGQTTAYDPATIKPTVLVMRNTVRYSEPAGNTKPVT